MLFPNSRFTLALLFATVTIAGFHNECFAAKAPPEELTAVKMQAYILQSEGPVSTNGLTRLQRTTGYRTNLDAVVTNFNALNTQDQSATLSTVVNGSSVIDQLFSPVFIQAPITAADKKINSEWASLKTALTTKYGDNTLLELQSLPAALQGRKDDLHTVLDQMIANTLAGRGSGNISGANTGTGTTGSGNCWRLSYRNLRRACHCQQCKQQCPVCN